MKVQPRDTIFEYSRIKKGEKRAQAVRQVQAAFDQLEPNVDEDGQEVRFFYLNGEPKAWRIRMKPSVEDIYSTLDVCKALGIQREKLRDWMDQGYIKPALPALGKGTIAIFTKVDVYGVALFDRLLQRGFKREAAAEYVRIFIMHPLANEMTVALFSEKLGEDGKVEIGNHFVTGPGTLRVEIDSKLRTKVGQVGKDGRVLAHPDEQAWDYLYIVNIASLRKEVDSAVADAT